MGLNDEEIGLNFSHDYNVRWGMNPIKLKMLKSSLVATARHFCPVDTGNMKENAIYGVTIPTGFKIVWDDRFAFYLPYVNEGINPLVPTSPKVAANKGFVDRGIAGCFLTLHHEISEGSFQYDLAEKFKDENGKNKYKHLTDRRVAPLFMKMQKDLNKGKIGETTLIRNEGMLERLRQSLTTAIITGRFTEDLGDVTETYDLDTQTVYEYPFGIEEE